MKDLKDLRITIFGDSIGKGVSTDNGKIEVIKDKPETKSPEHRPPYVYQIPLTFIPIPVNQPL